MADALLEKFDLYYTNSAGSKLGFMLAKGRYGVKAWRRVDERGLPDSFASGDISYANLSPDIQKVIAHRSLHGGLGALEFEVDDDELYNKMRYLRSEDIDNRCKGKSYPGPKVSTLPYPPAPTTYSDILNKNFEDWTATDPDDWTCSDADKISEEAVIVKSGSACKITTDGIEAAYVDQSFSGVTEYIGHIVIITAWARIDTASSVATLALYRNGVSVATDTLNGTADTYTQLSISYAVPEGTTALKVRCQGAGTVAGERLHYFDSMTLSRASAGVSSSMAVFNDQNYYALGKVLAKQNTANDGLLGFKEFATNITSIETFPVSGVDYLFIALGASNKYYYMDTDEAFTESNDTVDPYAQKFCKVGTALKKLILPNKIKSATDPTNGDPAASHWGSEKTLGEAAYNINDMSEYLGLLYCEKEDGIYYIDSSGNVQEPFPSLETLANTDAGKNSDVFRGRLYYRMGNQQEWEVDGSHIEELTPSLFAQGISEYAYPCVARAHDESWLYDLMYRGDNDVALLAGRWEYMAGRTRWIWHDIRKLTGITNASCALVSSVEGRPYLYIGSTVAGEAVQKVYLPVTNDATADSGYRFYTAGKLWLPRYTTLLYSFTKKWDEFFARSVNLTDTNYINIYRSIDDGATFTLLGKLDDSPEKTLTYPSGIEGTMMNLRLDFVGDSETVPPVFKYQNLKSILLMSSAARFYHTVKCADGLLLKKNHVASPNYTAKIIRTFMDTLRDEVCTLGDRWGTEHTVRVRIENEVEVYDEDTKNPEIQYSIEALKI